VNAPPARAGLTTMNTAWIMKFVYWLANSGFRLDYNYQMNILASQATEQFPFRNSGIRYERIAVPDFMIDQLYIWRRDLHCARRAEGMTNILPSLWAFISK
jgi:hypothetical protein